MIFRKNKNMIIKSGIVRMRFYIFTGGEKNPLYDVLFQDLKERQDVSVISEVPKIPARFMKLWKLHHSEKLNRYGALPFRGIWNSFLPVKDFPMNLTKQDCLVFSNVAIEWYEPALIKQWKKKYGINLILYLLDTMDSYYAKGARMALREIDFDAVYTYDRPDAEKYGFHFFDTYYSKLPAPEKADPCDVFFWGSEKGRGKTLLEISKILQNSGIQTEFGLCYVDEKEYEGSKIHCNQELSYQKMIERLNAAKCILDLKGENSKGNSLRTFEAYVYGKKLLTNNPRIFSVREYSPDWVYYFEKPEELLGKEAKQFITQHKNEPREYHGEFSPVHFIKRIEKDL